MNRHEIQQLLDEFLDGMTTVEQEQRLAEYFRSATDIPSEWEPFRRMFGWFDNGMQEPLAPIQSGHKRKYRFVTMLSAAASIAILIGVFMNMPETSTPLHPETSIKPFVSKPPLCIEAAQNPEPSSTTEKRATCVVRSTHNRLPPSENALAEAERIYNEQDHDMVDERYEDVLQAVNDQEVRSRGFFTAVDEQGNVRIIQCTNENTNQSNSVEL